MLYSVAGRGLGGLTREETTSKMRQAAAKALALDDTLPEAHIALGNIRKRYDWDWHGAEQAFRRAIELNPGHSDAHTEYGWLLIQMGRLEEALVETKRALELDPLSVVANFGVAEAYARSHQYDQAIERFRKTLELDANYAWAHVSLGQVYLRKGMVEEALAEIEEAMAVLGQDVLGFLGNAYAVSGRSDEARKALDELKERWRQGEDSAFGPAMVYAGLGEKGQAMAWLERAYEERAVELAYLKVHPSFESLHEEPRFQALLKKMGLAS